MDTNLADLLTSTARLAGDHVGVVEAGSGRRVTWSELEHEVDQVARSLSAQGLVPGYRVLLALANRTEFVTGYLGALRAGLVAVPVNPRAATGELLRILTDCGARMVLADAATVDSVRAAVAGLGEALEGVDPDLRARTPVPRVVVAEATPGADETSYEALLAERTPPAPQQVALPQTVDPETLAVLLYTSGTSGQPRAAMLTHRALLANIDQVASVEPPMVRTEDVVLGVLPLFHVYGLNAVLGQVLRQGARLVLVDGFDPEGVLGVVEAEAVSVVPAAPPVFAHWEGVADLGRRLGSVRLVLSGSAPLSPDLVRSFTERTGLAVHQGYGLTEAAPVVTSTLCGRSGTPSPAKPGSVGAALPGVEVRLADEDSRPPEGEDPGEILVRGDNLFSGYWPDGVDGPDTQGWWATGDVGFLDPDADLFLVDRVRELVIVSGFNVYPSEVEDVIVELAGVAEAAVIGAEDPATGEQVVAYVRAVEASSLSSDELAEQVRDHCAARLARFKQPAHVRVVDVLPHTVAGKVAKGRLRSTQRRRDQGLFE